MIQVRNPTGFLKCQLRGSPSLSTISSVRAGGQNLLRPARKPQLSEAPVPQRSHDDEIAGFGPRQLQHSLGWSFILGMQDVAVDAKFPGDLPAPVENLRGAAG
ncbi:hypothetical protein HNQ96_005415 [Aminobacter lissarensis]|uniref:Uncharacterized protein n=1 Tax=Aminobacter carboxidus TaxID=376165 RepID=A0A8E2BGK8_9HYPH|nr:hypothetical protein [Aminobacter lissarensis]MBB6469525.1 hypothetical protein [Aminobacter lissarensis]